VTPCNSVNRIGIEPPNVWQERARRNSGLPPVEWTASMEYFRVYWKDSPRFGLADAADRPRSEAKRVKWRKDDLTDWTEWEYTLTEGGFSDYQPESDGLRLCSDVLRRTLDAAKGPKDRLQWLPVWVTDDKRDRRRYWVLHFPEPADVLRTELIGTGANQRPQQVLDAAKLSGREVLPTPDGSFVSFLVSERARAAIERAECVGLQFLRTSASDSA
jgi:hypothetical protein